MKKKLAIMLLSSMVITGASYLTKSYNALLFTDDVEALSYGDNWYIVRRDTDEVDEHEGYDIKYNEWLPKKPIGPVNPNYVPPTPIIHIWVPCCFAMNGKTCDFAKDFVELCTNTDIIQGYVHPSHD